MDSYPWSITIDHHTSTLKFTIYDFFLSSWDSSWMDPASFKHDSSIIFTWFWSDFDMIFWWFSNDFLNILEWSQKHFCKSSDPVLDPAQNRSYRALVNRNPGFQAQLRSWYRPDHPRTTSTESPGLLTLNSLPLKGITLALLKQWAVTLRA